MKKYYEFNNSFIEVIGVNPQDESMYIVEYDSNDKDEYGIARTRIGYISIALVEKLTEFPF